VIALARIVRKAREKAGNHRRWCQWIRDELRMNRATIHRYLQVEAYVSRNVAARQHFEGLSIRTIQALSQLPRERARQVLHNGAAHQMSERDFLTLTRKWIPRKPQRTNRKNLMSMMNAALGRIEKTIRKWQQNSLVMTDAESLRMQSRLLAAEKALHRIATGAAAM
jgi:hypothetical protein